jgi:hypothetical protein
MPTCAVVNARKLSKTIGAKRVAAISKSQITRRVRSAFERWRLVSSYATEATELKNEKYKLEVRCANAKMLVARILLNNCACVPATGLPDRHVPAHNATERVPRD